MARQKANPSPWRNRIVGEAEVPAADLTANPRNWRTHPENQRAALDGVLSRVGWVQRVIVNRVTGFILDGHARVEQAAKRGEHVPVVEIDPGYCDVIVQRWQAFTGKAACNEDGETFESVARSRGLQVAA